jgi:hypothetical protein
MLYVMILVFLNLGAQRVNISNALMFTNKIDCEAQMPLIIAYQEGKQGDSGWTVNGFCVEVKPFKATGT